MNKRALVERQTCSALVITCSDFRFKHAEQAFADAAGLRDDYDLIARPGSIRSLVLPRNEAARTSMEEEILMLWRLHKFTRVLMVNHMSCRAYDDLVGDGDGREIHEQHLTAAAAIVEGMLDGARAEAYVVELGADGTLNAAAVAGARVS